MLSPLRYNSTQSRADSNSSPFSERDSDQTSTPLPDGTYQLDPDERGSYPGFPTIDEYEEIECNYLRGLSTRKQEKALITQDMYDSIHAVLTDPSNTGHGTPQFRFWVRKMFAVVEKDDGEIMVTHEDKPVAAREQIYQILVHCHGECFHGGRDKTCTTIKSYYSWIPKELIAQFVKSCPTCVLKRSNNPKKFVSMLKDIGGATGPAEQYMEYFTSPMRPRPVRPSGSAHSSATKSERDYIPAFSFKPEDRYPALSIPPCSPTASDYRHGAIDPFHRQSDAGWSSSSSQGPTPVSACFDVPGEHMVQKWSPNDLDDGGLYNAPMSRRAARSADEFRQPSWPSSGASRSHHHAYHRHLTAPAMCGSLSDSATPVYHGYDATEGHSFDGLHRSVVADETTVKVESLGHSYPYYDIPTQSETMQRAPSLAESEDFPEPIWPRKNSNSPAAKGDSYQLPAMHHQAQPELSIHLDGPEDSGVHNDNTFEEDHFPVTPEQNVRRSLAHRRLGAPAALNLSNSNFNTYRGDPALLSAVSIAGGAPNSASSFFGDRRGSLPVSSPLYDQSLTVPFLGHDQPQTAPACSELGGLTLRSPGAFVGDNHGLDVLSSASLAMESVPGLAVSYDVESNSETLPIRRCHSPTGGQPSEFSFESEDPCGSPPVSPRGVPQPQEDKAVDATHEELLG